MGNEQNNVSDAIWHQKDYCKRHNVPHFAPTTGFCFKCKHNIYEGPQAYSPEYAATHLITSCPYCNASFCD